MAWRDGKYMSLTPWKKLDNSSLSLLKNVLMHSPVIRYTIKDIKQHRWFVKKFQEGMRQFVHTQNIILFYNI